MGNTENKETFDPFLDKRYNSHEEGLNSDS